MIVDAPPEKPPDPPEPPRPLPRWARPDPAPEGWAARKARQHARARRISPFLLLDYRADPLVRAHMISTRKRRWAGGAACAAVPLAAFAALAFLENASFDEFPAAWLAGAFLCSWPLAMFVGGAIASASSTIAERDRGSAIQLVLTSIGRRPIAAAKVLPCAPPFLVGAAAALPFYLWAGGSPALFVNSELPGLLAAWPWRFLALLMPDWQLEVTGVGILAGLAMWVSDLAIVWAGLHWGAGYAVRLGRLVLVGLYLVQGTAILAAYTAVAWGLAFVVGLIFSVPLLVATAGEEIVVAWAVLWGGLAFTAGWWFYLRFGPVAAALAGFEHFDRLADEEFKPRLREQLSFKAWREHVFTSRR